jgi:type I restriction enzyme S subunit
MTQPIIDIPKEWIQTTIGLVCELNPKDKLQDDLDVAFMPMASVPVEFLGKPVYEIRKWHEVKKGYTQFKDGDTLFAKITPCFENGKACVVDKLPNGWGAGSTEYFVLRPINNLVHPKLLLALVKTKGFLFGGAINMTGSVGHKRVPKEFVENYPLQLPPLAEQHQIAAKLDELLAQVDSIKTRLDTIPKILKRFRQSVLAAAVSGQLTEDWRIINEYKNEWDYGVWSDILNPGKDSFKRGPFGSSLKKDMFVDKGYKVYEQYCPINDDCSYARYYVTPEKFEEMRAFEVLESDFLISCSGVSLGRITQVPKNSEKGIINQALLRVRIDLKKYNDDFFKILFRSPAFQKAIFENSTGSAIPNLKGVKELKAMPVPLPDLEEQTEIVRRVEQLSPTPTKSNNVSKMPKLASII